MESNYNKIKEGKCVKYEFGFDISDTVYCVFVSHIDEGIVDHILIDADGALVYDKHGSVIGDASSVFRDRIEAEKYWLEKYSDTMDKYADAELIIDIEDYEFNKTMYFDFAGYKEIPVKISENAKKPKLEILRQVVNYINNHNEGSDVYV